MIKEKCDKCGYSKHIGCLTKHHKDGDHENNLPENIQILCFNCHMELHRNGEVKIKRRFKEKSKTKKTLCKEVEKLTDVIGSLSVDGMPAHGLTYEIERYKKELRKLRLRYLKTFIQSGGFLLDDLFDFERVFGSPPEWEISILEAKYNDYLDMSFDDNDAVLKSILTKKLLGKSHDTPL